MAAASPTQRTLQECRKRGWIAHVVEKYNQYTRRKSDAFGFGDVLVVDDQPGARLIQATSHDHVSHRVVKIREECADAARDWLRAGNRISVWGWGRKGPRGARKLWKVREVEVTMVDLDAASVRAVERSA